MGKQSNNIYKPLISEIITECSLGGFQQDFTLSNQGEISKYITSYYEDIYNEATIDENRQAWFLSFIDTSINDSDNEELIRYVSDEEILLIMKQFNLNKSPGIDGLPIEFYIRFFNVIKDEFCQVLRNSLISENLTESQRKALIILLYKGGDQKLISSWRPISLICVDTKILSKLIAHRVKKVLYKCISQEQYCGKEKSIVECNNTIRDLFYFINENK